MNPNQLAAWLQIADKSNYGGKGWSDSASSYDPSGRRLEWAARMAQEGDRQMPDFFANQPGRMSGGGPGEDRGYVQPQQFAPQQQPIQYGQIPQGPSGQPLGQEMNAYAGGRPLPPGEGQMRPDVLNYLTKLLGGRGRYGY